MDRDEFRRQMARADIDLTLLTELTGYDRKHAITLGRSRPVPRYVRAIVAAYYLMDGPTREKLRGAIGDTETPA